MKAELTINTADPYQFNNIKGFCDQFMHDEVPTEQTLNF